MTLNRLFRVAAMLLVAALFNNSLAFAAKRPVDPTVMKAKIQARGVGQGVRVLLADKTEVKGLIVAIGDRSFTLKPRTSADVQQIEYAQLTGVHNDHLTRGQKVGIVVAVAAGVLVIVTVVVIHKLDNTHIGPLL